MKDIEYERAKARWDRALAEWKAIPVGPEKNEARASLNEEMKLFFAEVDAYKNRKLEEAEDMRRDAAEKRKQIEREGEQMRRRAPVPGFTMGVPPIGGVVDARKLRGGEKH